MAPLHPDVQWNHEASMRSHAGLLPLYSDRDTQGLTSHVTLCPVCFPDAIKDVEKKKKKCTSSEPLAFPAGEIWRACLQICHPPGVWWATRAAVWAPRERRQEGNNCPLIKLAATRVYRRIWTCQATQLLELSRCYGTSSPPTFYFQLLRLWAGMRCWHQFISPTNEAVKRLRSQIVTRGLLNSWMNSEALKSSVSDLLFLLDAVGLNSVQGEKKRFLCPITGNKSTLPMRSHPVTYHLSVVLSALQEFLCKVI